MFRAFSDICGRLLRIPPQPEPPPGDEASARVFRAAPQYFKYRLVLWLIVTVKFLVLLSIPAILINFAVSQASRPGHPRVAVHGVLFFASLLPFIIVGLRLISLALLRLDYEKRWYVVTDRSLRVREGIFFVSEMTITFANVQNLSISQGPIQRALGIADLVVETAGGGSISGNKQHGMNLHTACFRGIDNATEVKELIQQRLRALKDSGLGHHEERAAIAPRAAQVSPTLLSALRAVHEEARVLRETAAQPAV